MIRLENIEPTIILDSRGEQTVEVSLSTDSFSAKASVPCGKSKGSYEAFCHTVGYSVNLIEKITPQLTGREFTGQEDFDRLILKMDGTENKETLGVNVTLSLSIAFCRLLAKTERLELYSLLRNLADVSTPKFPLLFFNLINGGLHVSESLNPLPFQEYLAIPRETSPKKATQLIYEFIDGLKVCLDERSCPLVYGDEGGFIISGDNPKNGFEIFDDNLRKKSPDFGKNFYFGLDAASSSLWKKIDTYSWRSQNWSSSDLANIYQQLLATYPLLSIEDPFSQESWSDWSNFKKGSSDKVWVVGDDLTVTNVKRMKKAKELDCVNAVLIKPNQIGTVLETLEAVKLAREFGWKIIVSHRSGETTDDFIADLAYGVAADGLKAGSPLQKERLVKYKRLIEIERAVTLT